MNGNSNNNTLDRENPTTQQPEPIDLANCFVYGFLDPALGGDDGDDAAIAVVARDPAGCLYLLDLWLERATPSRQIARAFELHARWRFTRFGVETNSFQRLLIEPFEAERRARRAAGQPWDLPIHPVRHAGSKRDRIAAVLEPLVQNGWLRFNRHLPDRFWDQLAAFPHSRRDDGLDALAAAAELARPSCAALDSATPLALPRANPARAF